MNDREQVCAQGLVTIHVNILSMHKHVYEIDSTMYIYVDIDKALWTVLQPPRYHWNIVEIGVNHYNP